MCSGTMSQLTTGPHLPVVASGGSGETETGEEVTLAAPAVNSRVWDPEPLIPRSPNLRDARRIGRGAGVPLQRAPAGCLARRDLDARPPESPPASVTWTTGCTAGSNTSPLNADTGGLVVITMPPAAAAERDRDRRQQTGSVPGAVNRSV